MRLVDYIYNAGSGSYGLDLGYRPTTATSVEVRGMPYVDGGLWIGTGPESSQPYGQWFRLFTYQENIITFDCPEDSSWRANVGFDGSADYELFGFGFNTDGDIYLTTTAGTEICPMTTFDLSAFDGVNNSTLKCWGDGTYPNGGTSKFYEIWIYEAGQLVRHYLPAVDDVWDIDEQDYKTIAGLYEEIGQQFYGKVAGSPDIDWNEKDAIEYDSISNVIFAASGGTTGATLVVNAPLSGENYHWGVKQLTDLNGMASAFTLNYNGQSGLTEISGKTDGTISFEYAVGPWDGSDASGGTYDKKYRTAVWHITMFDDSTGQPWGGNDYPQRVRQINPVSSGQPVFIGEEEVSTMFIGEEEVLAAYLGEDLVFEG